MFITVYNRLAEGGQGRGRGDELVGCLQGLEATARMVREDLLAAGCFRGWLALMTRLLLLLVLQMWQLFLCL
jgi:hypothetical protein